MKSFNFMGTKFRGLMTMDMYKDTWIRGFQIICNITKLNEYFVAILHLYIALPAKKHEIKCPMNKMSSQLLCVGLFSRCHLTVSTLPVSHCLSVYCLYDNNHVFLTYVKDKRMYCRYWLPVMHSMAEWSNPHSR